MVKMQKSRNSVKNLLSSIKYHKEKYVYFKKDIISLSTQAEYDRTVEHYDQLIDTLKKEMQMLPIGYRYTGMYYIKKPYTIPAEFEEGHGSLFMRENLVSWQIEKEPGVLEYPYYRAVFKQPNGAYLTKEDAEPIYN